MGGGMGSGGGGLLSGFLSGAKGAATAAGQAVQPALKFGAGLAGGVSGGDFLRSMFQALSKDPTEFTSEDFLNQFYNQNAAALGTEPLTQAPMLSGLRPTPEASPDYLNQLISSLGPQSRMAQTPTGGAFSLGPQHSLRIGQLIAMAAAAA